MRKSEVLLKLEEAQLACQDAQQKLSDTRESLSLERAKSSELDKRVKELEQELKEARRDLEMAESSARMQKAEVSKMQRECADRIRRVVAPITLDEILTAYQTNADTYDALERSSSFKLTSKEHPEISWILSKLAQIRDCNGNVANLTRPVSITGLHTLEWVKLFLPTDLMLTRPEYVFCKQDEGDGLILTNPLLADHVIAVFQMSYHHYINQFVAHGRARVLFTSAMPDGDTQVIRMLIPFLPEEDMISDAQDQNYLKPQEEQESEIAVKLATQEMIMRVRDECNKTWYKAHFEPKS